MEVDCSENDKLTCSGEIKTVQNENVDTLVENSPDLSKDHFKKPILIGKVSHKKSTLYKYLQQKKDSDIKNTNENEEANPVTIENKLETKSKNNSECKSNKSVPIPYTEPEWKGIAPVQYQLEELKSGVIERTIDLNKKSFYVFGRVDACDICMAHPTVSRFHAVLQYRGTESDENEKGFYLYDLDSTHGTFLNKYRMKSKIYARVKVGHMIKIGCSTRFFILKGPAEDEEEESPLSMTDLKTQRLAEIEERNRKLEEERLLEEQERERQERLLEERGISWGMGEDADEESDLSENPYALVTNEELYIDDPKKALRNWFDREGEELTFDIEKAEKGLFVAKVILPIDGGDGREIVIEMTGRSKKEAQIQCCLEACRTIDKMGLLRPAKREAKKQQKRNWEENDYYDSDEDSFLDRTGDLDKKREKRMRKAGKIQDSVETYDSLMEKHKIVLEKLEGAEKTLNNLSNEVTVTSVSEPGEDVDELDAYMLTLKQKKPQKIDIKIAKENLNKLREEEVNLRKLINIAKPANLPELILRKTAVIEEVSSSDCSTSDNGGEKIVKKNLEVRSQKQEIGEAEESKETTNKVIGPTLPPATKMNKEVKPKEKIKKKVIKEDDPNCVEDDVYSNCVWKPPPGQTGDGRTSLNDKYGY